MPAVSSRTDPSTTAADNEPVFRATGVALVAEAFPGPDHHPLDLVTFGVVEDGEASPRPFV
jgi:hypothetical protein